MDQLFKELSYSQKEDSSWVPKLIVSIPQPHELNIASIDNPNLLTKKR